MKNYTSTKLYLSIYRPVFTYSGRVTNTTQGIGTTTINFNNGSGNLADVKVGQTAYIGTALYSDNKGRVRVRSITSGTLVVAANSDINWTNTTTYFTIYDFHEVWPVYQKAQQIGNTPSTADIMVWKDDDIEYIDQNDHPGTLICMGSHRAANLIDGHAYLDWSATGTVNTENATITYSWSFGGGTPSSSTAQIPGTVQYNSAGHWTTSLTTTSVNGTVDVSYRHVSIYDLNSSQKHPIQHWGMSDIRGSRSEGGYSTSIWIKQGMTLDSQFANVLAFLLPGALVVIYSDRYNSVTKEEVRNQTEFVGYIKSESLEYDSVDEIVKFEVGGIMDILSGIEIPGIVVTSTAVPDAWVEMKDITMRKALWYFLRWHTTVLQCTDVQYLGTDYMMFRFESDNSKIADVLSNFMQTAVVGSAAANRKGQLFFEVDPMAIHNAITSIALQSPLTRSDWMNRVEIERTVKPDVSYIEMYGYSYDSVTGSSTIYRSCSPGTTPSFAGNMEEYNGLSVVNQEELSRIVGDVYAYRNSKYSRIGMSLKGNYPDIDFVPNQRYLLTIEAGDSFSYIQETNLPIHPTSLTWKYDPENSFFAPDVDFHEITNGSSGTALKIPEVVVENPVYTPPSFDFIPPDIPGMGQIPWPNPFISPKPLPCYGQGYNYDEPRGGYYAYPEDSYLNYQKTSTYVWFPCIVAGTYANAWRNWTWVEVNSNNPGALITLSTIRQDKSIIESVSLAGGIAQFMNPTPYEIAGFKITMFPYGPGHPYLIRTVCGGSASYISDTSWNGGGFFAGYTYVAGNLTNWALFSPYGAGFRLHTTVDYLLVSNERVKVRKLGGGSEGIAIVPSSQYETCAHNLFAGGYNPHTEGPGGSYWLASVGATINRDETSHAASSYTAGDYCFGLTSYYDDAFGTEAHHYSSYEIDQIDLNVNGTWTQVWGPNVEKGYQSVTIYDVIIHNVCPAITIK